MDIDALLAGLTYEQIVFVQILTFLALLAFCAFVSWLVVSLLFAIID